MSSIALKPDMYDYNVAASTIVSEYDLETKQLKGLVVSYASRK